MMMSIIILLSSSKRFVLRGIKSISDYRADLKVVTYKLAAADVGS